MPRSRVRWLTAAGTLAVAIFSWATLSTLAGDTTPAPTLAEIRRAAGSAHLPSGGQCLSIQGDARFRGTETTYALLLGPDGSFRHSIDGPLATLVASDGNQVWQRDAQSAVFELELLMKEAFQLGVWFDTGYWLSPDAAVVIHEPENVGSGFRVELGLENGWLEADITLDRQTHLPARVDLKTFAVDASVEYSDYRPVGGLNLPHVIKVVHEAGLADEFRVQDAEILACSVEELSRMPQGIGDASFDSSRPSRLELRRISTGHIVVKPVIDGKETGWFILDSGAGASVITPAAAKRLGLKAIGKSVLAGSGANVATTTLRASDSFRLGPMTVEGLVFLEMDLGAVAPALREIEGVIGWDILIRARVEFDLAAPDVRLLDSAGGSGAQPEWQPLVLHGKRPLVRGGVEGDHWGLFMLDTGAANTTLVMHSPTVERLSLLDGRTGATNSFTGAGGSSRYVPSRLAWVELAGHRYTDLPVRLSLDKAGGMADPYAFGTVGVNILRDLSLTFDYPHQRIALQKR